MAAPMPITGNQIVDKGIELYATAKVAEYAPAVVKAAVAVAKAHPVGTIAAAGAGAIALKAHREKLRLDQVQRKLPCVELLLSNPPPSTADQTVHRKYRHDAHQALTWLQAHVPDQFDQYNEMFTSYLQESVEASNGQWSDGQYLCQYSDGAETSRTEAILESLVDHVDAFVEWIEVEPNPTDTYNTEVYKHNREARKQHKKMHAIHREQIFRETHRLPHRDRIVTPLKQEVESASASPVASAPEKADEGCLIS